MRRDSGTVTVYRLVDVTERGDMPKRVLSPISRQWYAERTIGYGRYYAAQGVNEQVDMLIRIPYDARIRIGMFAVLGNGEQFRIGNVQPTTDDDGLRCVDLTLARLETLYDIQRETETNA